jgi:hypothetical protein
MTLFTFDPEIDVDTACLAVGFLPNLGATLSNLEAINGVSYQPGTRFGTALAAAVQRGLVRFDGARYHLVNQEG